MCLFYLLHKSTTENKTEKSFCRKLDNIYGGSEKYRSYTP